MELHLDPAELVRCVDCHAIYAKLAESSALPADASCPECGAGAWLAAEIPLPKLVPATRA